MRLLFATAALLPTLASVSYAQGHSHADKTGPHGGKMQDVAGIEAELISAERTLTIHLFSEDGKPVSAAGYSGSALVGSGQTRQVVQLVAGSDNRLTGNSGTAVARGAPITLQLKGPDGKAGQAKF